LGRAGTDDHQQCDQQAIVEAARHASM
jgi:hypothetical protein